MSVPTTSLTIGELKAAMVRLAKTILGAEEWQQSSWHYGPGKWAQRGPAGDRALRVAGSLRRPGAPRLQRAAGSRCDGQGGPQERP